MESQNYKTHVKIDPLYHYVLLFLLLATLVISLINLVRSFNAGENILQSILLLLMVVCIIIVAILVRLNPLKNQDRSIRAEENLRHYVLTGKLLDSNLTKGQIIALRFAGVEDFPTLCERAVNDNPSPDDIKKSIVSWKADHHRI